MKRYFILISVFISLGFAFPAIAFMGNPYTQAGFSDRAVNTLIANTGITTPAITAPGASLVIKPTTDAVNAVQVQDKDGNAIVNIDTTNDRFAVGTPTPDTRLHAEIDNATTNATTNVQTLTHTTSGTPAANIGAGLAFEVETAAANNEVVGVIEGIATGVGAGTEQGAVVIKTMTAGAAATEDVRFADKKMTISSLTTAQSSETVADEASITLATGVAGWGFAQAGDNEQWIQFCFTTAGVVTVIANSALAVNTDTDGNLCVYDAGSGIAIKNRLGASKTIRYLVNYSS